MNVIKLDHRRPRNFESMDMFKLLEEMHYFTEKYSGPIISSLVLLEGINLFTAINKKAVTEELRTLSTEYIYRYTNNLKKISEK